MTQEELKDHTVEYIDYDQRYLLEVSMRRGSNLPNWVSPYYLRFNARFESFKTFRGLKNRVDRLIEKYDLQRDLPF